MIAVVGRIAAPGLAKTDVAGPTPHGAALESAPHARELLDDSGGVGAEPTAAERWNSLGPNPASSRHENPGRCFGCRRCS